MEDIILIVAFVSLVYSISSGVVNSSRKQLLSARPLAAYGIINILQFGSTLEGSITRTGRKYIQGVHRSATTVPLRFNALWWRGPSLNPLVIGPWIKISSFYKNLCQWRKHQSMHHSAQVVPVLRFPVQSNTEYREQSMYCNLV